MKPILESITFVFYGICPFVFQLHLIVLAYRRNQWTSYLCKRFIIQRSIIFYQMVCVGCCLSFIEGSACFYFCALMSADLDYCLIMHRCQKLATGDTATCWPTSSECTFILYQLVLLKSSAFFTTHLPLRPYNALWEKSASFLVLSLTRPILSWRSLNRFHLLAP